MSTTWFAPGRVNLIGEHTDYNDGLSLPFAIGQGCRATVAPAAGSAHVVRSAQEDDVVTVARGAGPGDAEGLGWAAYVAGVLWALPAEVPPLQVTVDGDVPAGAGLSSSAALECSVAGAVAELLGLDLRAAELAAVARRAENDFVGVPTGGLDQLASTSCSSGAALLVDFASGATRPVPLPLPDATILVVDTRAPHRLADGAYAARRSACERAATALDLTSLRQVDDLDVALRRLADPELRRVVRHVVTENERVRTTVAALDAGDLWAVGPLLTASHVSLRDDYRVTVPELDVAQQALLAAGAAGARMTGGGFGGSVIALLRPAQVPAAVAAVDDAFAAHGFAAPTAFETAPSVGAHRVAPATT